MTLIFFIKSGSRLREYSIRRIWIRIWWIY